ncbi:MAG: phosphatidylinositol-specific phospholipase C/glycerophosphodiester phosphodiesterase family protein [Bacteroidota bacterium]|nr:phosphatidylinositol-specific phospholipase C/glycerophosphodiester phosphodiesterase family protein [Bacteroidota bacterium]
MRQSLLVICFFLFNWSNLKAQNSYTSANVHAHNDYQQPQPFFNAISRQVGSIEADVFLKDGELYVAHEAKEISKDRTLETLYLKPLQAQIRKNKGSVYADLKVKLQFLIDFKTEGNTTLPALVQKLVNYPEIINNPTIQLVISGNRPHPSTWEKFPGYIYFDGTPGENYTAEQLNRVALFSANFRNYSKWDGTGSLEKADEIKLQQAIEKAHGLNKKWRFWATPDNVNAWKTMMQVGVDYIGTDDVNGITTFLKNVQAK